MITMKYAILLLAGLQSSCIHTQNASNSNSLEKQLQTGADVYVEGRTFSDDLDFTKILPSNLISEGVFQGKTTSSVTFRNCTFKGAVLAYKKESETKSLLTSFLSNVSFLNCTFEKEVNFRGCSIQGLADFSRSTFKAGAVFEESGFAQNAFFNNCIFAEETRFQNAFFHRKTTFMEARFDRNVSFQSAVFFADVQFSVAKFYGYADFSLIHCHQGAFFNYGEFTDRAHFNNATFGGRLDFIKVLVNKGNFQKCYFSREARFQQCEINTQLDLQGSFFFTGIQEDLWGLEKEKILR